MINEENYPMTYEEYERRVVELFLEDYGGERLETMKERVDLELSNRPNCIEGAYGHDCFVYDHPEIYGKTCKKAFEDSFLRQTAVANLRMLIG